MQLIIQNQIDIAKLRYKNIINKSFNIIKNLQVIHEKKNIIDIKEDGSFHLDQSYFNYATGLTMTSEKFNSLFGRKARNPKLSEEIIELDQNL